MMIKRELVDLFNYWMNRLMTCGLEDYMKVERNLRNVFRLFMDQRLNDNIKID